MRVLAYYGPKDIRDEEWPRPKKLPEGRVRVAVRAVTLGGKSRFAYLENSMAVPCAIGETAAGIIEESAAEGFVPGQPVILWNDDPEKAGLAAESLVWPAERVFAPSVAASYGEMALLPLWAEVLGDLEEIGEGRSAVVLGTGPQAEIARILVPLSGCAPAEEGREADAAVCCEADDNVLEKAALRVKKGGTVRILSLSPGSRPRLSPLALRKGFCFNFGTVCQKEALAKIFDLTGKGGLSLVCENKLFSWDEAEKAMAELEKGSLVTLRQDSFDEPYFP